MGDLDPGDLYDDALVDDDAEPLDANIDHEGPGAFPPPPGDVR